MEIQNIQSGQGFASIGASIRSEPNLTKRSLENDNKDSDEQNNRPPTALKNEVTVSSEVEKELSQASSLQADKKENEKQLDDAISKVESFLKVQNRDLAFSIDEETNRSIVTVKDSQSGDVIRQIPSEEVLKLAERIQELQQDVGNSVGVFINNQV